MSAAEERTVERWEGDRIPPERWSRDHWTTVAYAFTCLGSHGGTLDAAKMRTKRGAPSRGHRGHEQSAMTRLAFGDREYPTKLQAGVDLYKHDDWDCIEDAEAAGLLAWKGTGMRPIIEFTPAGLVLGAWLCRCIDERRIPTATITWEQALLESGAADLLTTNAKD